MASIISAMMNGVSGLVPPLAIARDEVTGIYEPNTNATVEEQAQAMEVDADSVVPHLDSAPQVLASGSSSSMTMDAPQRASSLPAVLKPDARTVAYVYDAQMLLHFSASGHPEAPERIVQIYQILKDGGYIDRMKHIPIRKVKKGEALLVHSEDHWEKVEIIQRMTTEDIVNSEAYYEHLSLYVCPTTPHAAQLSCGGVIEAALAVARGQFQKSFAIVRPPGHHAEPEEHMGFCFFNNVAVAARVVQQLTPLKRVMILDWDVHHGNGTQRAFLDDPSVLYVSIHRFDGGQFYPCGPFGGLDSCGEGPGLGTSVNVPWPEKGMGDADYIHAFQKIVMPIAMEFAPELVMISAGFDAADGDELGECHVTPAGYAHMTHMLASLAGGKLIVALEGGYNLSSISNSALAVAGILVGGAPPELAPMVASEVATETVWQVAIQQSKFWKSIDPKACEPRETLPELTVSIPEILKAHRQEYMYQHHNMLQIPLIDELAERFDAQVMCSEDVMEQDTIVLLVHQFGNIRVELAGAMTCDMNLEYSYLVDVTRDLVHWVREQKYAFVEVNTYPRPLLRNRSSPKESLGREVMTYLWDNYIQLSKATRIVLIGHGEGCQAVMDLVAARVHTVMRRVKAVVQVVGSFTIPMVPKGDDDLKAWYFKHSLVVVPRHHEIVTNIGIIKRHGRVEKYDEEKPVKLMSRALPDIQLFIQDRVKTPSNQPVGHTQNVAELIL